jgi:hypothetical protein
MSIAIRYSEKTKREVVNFVRKYDKEHGRGGKTAAKKKFGINAISITRWVGASTLNVSKENKILEDALRSIRDNEALNGYQCREVAANALFDAHFE